jgi:predicted lipoprotein with Yx(FWY)xxD motif
MLRATRALPAAAALACAVAAAAPAPAAAARPPVTVMTDRALGPILATSARQALYVWNAERPGTVRCTGACARVWPPLIVRSRAAVPRRVRGVPGRLGVIRRPDGRLQVTWNRRPLYAYHDDPRGVALCDDVDGWFAIRGRRA